MMVDTGALRAVGCSALILRHHMTAPKYAMLMLDGALSD
jgi:hypothetical protein